MKARGASLPEYSMIIAAFAIALIAPVAYFGRDTVERLYHIILAGWPS